MVDNNIFFYELKKCFKDIIFISIQNGIRFVTGDILEILQKNKINEKYLVDYYLIYNSLVVAGKSCSRGEACRRRKVS